MCCNKSRYISPAIHCYKITPDPSNTSADQRLQNLHHHANYINKSITVTISNQLKDSNYTLLSHTIDSSIYPAQRPLTLPIVGTIQHTTFPNFFFICGENIQNSDITKMVATFWTINIGVSPATTSV